MMIQKIVKNLKIHNNNNNKINFKYQILICNKIVFKIKIFLKKNNRLVKIFKLLLILMNNIVKNHLKIIIQKFKTKKSKILKNRMMININNNNNLLKQKTKKIMINKKNFMRKNLTFICKILKRSLNLLKDHN